MPRPNPLPRRAPEPSDDPFPPWRPVAPMRPLASVNLLRVEKSVFDAYQLWVSYREGRAVQQWEVFSFLFRVALEHRDHPLMRGFELPRPPVDDESQP